jgi:hypothetical protein
MLMVVVEGGRLCYSCNQRGNTTNCPLNATVLTVRSGSQLLLLTPFFYMKCKCFFDRDITKTAKLSVLYIYITSD